MEEMTASRTSRDMDDLKPMLRDTEAAVADTAND